MKTYDVARLPSLVTLGYDGENNWRPIQFDCSVLLANHPSGTISLWLLPEGETQAFPVALERDGNSVTWTPLNEEMTSERGAFQLVCTDGTDVGKSAVVLFRVDDSVVPGAEHPAAVPSWAAQTIERAEAAADRAEAAADSIDTDAIAAMIAQAIEDYLEQHPIQAPVQSVNGETGAVVLGASDVGALPANTHIPDDAVWRGEWSVSENYDVGDFVSYNGTIYRCNTGGIGIYPDEETGWDEWFGASNLGAYVKPNGGIPKTDLAQAVQTSLGKADTALQTAPVTSVNSMTGAVVIPLAQPGETHINVLNPAVAEQGYIAAQGQINNSDTYWSTGYIAVSEGDVLRVFYDGANKNHAYAAEYSTQAQSGFISRTDNGSYASYTVQHDGYVRLSIKTSAVPWANVSTAMVTINDTDSTYIAYGDLGANDGLMSAADKKKLDGLGRSAGKKVFDKFLFIAYSSFGDNAPNSVPHYEDCAQKDYDWLKADIQPTSDGGLVCCHDSGFTLDGNGRITTYNSSSATEIYTMTLAQATALVYASYPTTHVASIDDFLEVCKRYGKTPYITIRDAHMDVVVPALMAALDKFALRSVAVINSSTRASLDAVRTADKDITMSLFVNPFGSSMASGYNYALADGNTMLGYFYTQSSHTWAEFIASSTIAGYIADCIENGIVMWAGIESDASHVDDLIAMGFSGIHTMQDRPSPIPTKTSDLTNDSGFQTAAQVQSAIAAAAELPAVTASDNGKFLRVVSGAWAAQTVPSAESNSFGGGS